MWNAKGDPGVVGACWRLSLFVWRVWAGVWSAYIVLGIDEYYTKSLIYPSSLTSNVTGINLLLNT